MPKIPPWLKGFNGIVYLLENPCNDPWVVYAQSAFPAVGQAALTILSFGMDDVMRGYFRPTKGLRALRHGRRGAKGRRIRGIPEIGETIGEKLPGREFFAQRTLSQGIHHLWIIDGVIQRGLWYWMLLDIINDFFYDWATALFESHEGEDCAGASVLATGVIEASHALFGWNAPFVPTVKYSNGGLSWDTIFIDLPPGHFRVVFGTKTRVPPGPGTTYQLGLANSGTFTEFYALSDVITIPGGSTADCIVSADVQGPDKVVIGQRNGFSDCYQDELYVFISQEP